MHPICSGHRAGPVPPACCNGIRSLNSAAKTNPDLRAACQCLKSIASSISRINYGLVAGAPGNCGVGIPYKIAPSTNCDKYVVFAHFLYAKCTVSSIT
ncbi:hypothetical protein CDL15_Pgr007669 [Punica granatum]|uniref:Non-specific lipid-transfer protein n=1 Tax=Punica granatum TaxID=22663 RepID=A0A218XAV6_PUNGR|nr:hypothetical protein CDL15_Pgr007669 [Punica granatum]PKI40947.1 hypothetical protein CRG98_038475 [Punica granatum]